jgi:hypothetical protein
MGQFQSTATGGGGTGRTNDGNAPKSYFLPAHLSDTKAEYDILKKNLYPTPKNPNLPRPTYMDHPEKVDNFKVLDHFKSFNSKAKPDLAKVIYQSDHYKANIKKIKMGRVNDADTMNYLIEDKKIVPRHDHNINGDIMANFLGIPNVTEKYNVNSFSNEDQELLGPNKTHLDLMLRNWRKQTADNFNLDLPANPPPPPKGKRNAPPKPTPTPPPTAGGGTGQSSIKDKNFDWVAYFRG